MNNEAHPCHPFSPCTKKETEGCARNIIDYCLTSNAPTCKSILETLNTKFLTRTTCPFAPAFSPCSPVDKTLVCKNSFGFEPKCFINLGNFCNEPISTTPSTMPTGFGSGSSMPTGFGSPTTTKPPSLGTTKKGVFTTKPTTTTTVPTINPNTKKLYCESIVKTVNDFTLIEDASNTFNDYSGASNLQLSLSVIGTCVLSYLFL